MRICVIDGHGGGLGSRLVSGLQARIGDGHHLIGLGTNRTAASAMKAAGAAEICAGTDAILQVLPTVDVILTSLSIVVPHPFQGDVTPLLIRAILRARAKKVLLPVNRAHVEVVGTEDYKLEQLIARSIHRVKSIVSPDSLV